MKLLTPHLSPGVCLLLSLTLLVTGCGPMPDVNRSGGEQYLLASRNCSACVPQNSGLNRSSVGSSVMAPAPSGMKFEPVYFDTDKSKIRQEAQGTLDRITSVIRASRPGRIVINGHTDSRADSAYNIGLSMRRANAVKRELINRGIERDRLEVQGHGETLPADSNSSDRGRQNNRRVEVTLH